MVVHTRYVPYSEDSYFGIFRQLAIDARSSNISKNGFTVLTASSNHEKYPVNVNDIIMDTKTMSWWSTSDVSDPNPYFIIDMGVLRASVEGYAISTDLPDYMPKWTVYGYTEDSEEIILDTKTLSQGPSKTLNTYKLDSPSEKIRYIKMESEGQRFGGGVRFAIYDFDIFGTLFIPSFFNITNNSQRSIIMNILILIFIIK